MKPCSIGSAAIGRLLFQQRACRTQENPVVDFSLAREDIGDRKEPPVIDIFSMDRIKPLLLKATPESEDCFCCSVTPRTKSTSFGN